LSVIVLKLLFDLTHFPPFWTLLYRVLGSLSMT